MYCNTLKIFIHPASLAVNNMQNCGDDSVTKIDFCTEETRIYNTGENLLK